VVLAVEDMMDFMGHQQAPQVIRLALAHLKEIPAVMDRQPQFIRAAAAVVHLRLEQAFLPLQLLERAVMERHPVFLARP
jgi:hypothetical protein